MEILVKIHVLQMSPQLSQYHLLSSLSLHHLTLGTIFKIYFILIFSCLFLKYLVFFLWYVVFFTIVITFNFSMYCILVSIRLSFSHILFQNFPSYFLFELLFKNAKIQFMTSNIYKASNTKIKIKQGLMR